MIEIYERVNGKLTPVADTNLPRIQAALRKLIVDINDDEDDLNCDFFGKEACLSDLKTYYAEMEARARQKDEKKLKETLVLRGVTKLRSKPPVMI